MAPTLPQRSLPRSTSGSCWTSMSPQAHDHSLVQQVQQQGLLLGWRPSLLYRLEAIPIRFIGHSLSPTGQSSQRLCSAPPASQTRRSGDSRRGIRWAGGKLLNLNPQCGTHPEPHHGPPIKFLLLLLVRHLFLIAFCYY